jgi:hypothetical protein
VDADNIEDDTTADKVRVMISYRKGSDEVRKVFR